MRYVSVADWWKRFSFSQINPARKYIDGFVQGYSNSSALAMELLQCCTKPSICFACDVLRPHLRHVLAIISQHEIMNHSTSNPNHDIHQIVTQIISTRTKDRDKNGGFTNFMGFRDMFQIAHEIKTPFLRIIYMYIYIYILNWVYTLHQATNVFFHIKSATVAWDHISFFRTKA